LVNIPVAESTDGYSCTAYDIYIENPLRDSNIERTKSEVYNKSLNLTIMNTSHSEDSVSHKISTNIH
jgi:hypothetical protein